MVKNKKLKSLAVIGLTASLLLGSGYSAFASDTGIPAKSTTREVEYTTTNKDEDPAERFAATIIDDDKIFNLTDIKTEIIKTEQMQGEYLFYDSPAFIDGTEVQKPNETSEKDGIIYTLKSTEILSRRIEERTKYVESEVTIEDLEWLDDIPKTSEIKVEDKSTGQVIASELPLIKILTDEEKWVSTFTFPITIRGYDLNYFMLGDSKISKEDSLLDYKEEFLDYLGLPKDKYKISSIEWNGDSYTKGGEVRRNATAYGQKSIHDIKAVYGGEAVLPSADGTYYHCTYVNPEKPGNTVYTIKATGTYTEPFTLETHQGFLKSLIEWLKANPIAAFSLGTMGILTFILIIFFILSRKKKKKEENKPVEVIDIKRDKEG